MRQPEISSSFNSSGMAVISLDFWSVATEPRATPLAVAEALTRWRALVRPLPSLVLPPNVRRLVVAINGNDLTSTECHAGSHPQRKRRLKLLRINEREHSAKRVMRRDSLFSLFLLEITSTEYVVFFVWSNKHPASAGWGVGWFRL